MTLTKATEKAASAAEKSATKPDTINGTVGATELRKALRAILKASPEIRHTIPVLRCVILEFKKDGRLVVAHPGIDMTIAMDLPAEGRGIVCVPAAKLSAFLSGADGHEVEISKGDKDAAATFRCGEFTASIVAVHHSEAPEWWNTFQIGDNGRTVQLAEGIMRWLLGLTIPFVSSEETRYYLNGVCIEIKEGADGQSTMRAIATDGHRLGTRETVLPASVTPLDSPVIIPRFTVKAVFDLAGNQEVTVAISSMYASFSFGNTVIRTKLIDGTFPDWRRVVPKGPFKEIMVDGNKLVRLAKSVKALGDGSRGGRAVKIEQTPDGIALAAQGPDNDAVTLNTRATLSAEEAFDAFGINAQYLAGVASAFGTKQITIGTIDAGSPMMITAPETNKGDREFAIVMPMRI